MCDISQDIPLVLFRKKDMAGRSQISTRRGTEEFSIGRDSLFTRRDSKMTSLFGSILSQPACHENSNTLELAKDNGLCVPEGPIEVMSFDTVVKKSNCLARRIR